MKTKMMTRSKWLAVFCAMTSLFNGIAFAADKQQYQLFNATGEWDHYYYGCSKASEIALNEAMAKCARAGYLKCGALRADGSFEAKKTHSLTCNYVDIEKVDWGAVTTNIIGFPLMLATFGYFGPVEITVKSSKYVAHAMVVGFDTLDDAIGRTIAASDSRSKYIPPEAEEVAPTENNMSPVFDDAL